jgi:hypothetical protein
MKKCIHITVSGSHRSKMLDFMNASWDILEGDTLCGIIKSGTLFRCFNHIYTPLSRKALEPSQG